MMRKRRVMLLAATVWMVACGSSSSGGTLLALGTEAVVGYSVQASGSTPAVDTSLGVTVLAVRPGTQAELEAGGFTVEDKDSTPYYVNTRYSNKGKGPLPRNLSVGMEDTKGNSVPTTLIMDLSGTPFAPCTDHNDSATTLEPGDSYETCTLFLVPKGTRLAKVRFVSQSSDATITFTDWATK
jgi:hypothetical protein